MEQPRAIVVTKDKPRGQEMVAFLTEKLDFNPVWVADGEAAFNVLDAEHVDVLLTDFQAQRLDGMRLLEIARSRNPEIAVILMAPSLDLAAATEAMAPKRMRATAAGRS